MTGAPGPVSHGPDRTGPWRGLSLTSPRGLSVSFIDRQSKSRTDLGDSVVELPIEVAGPRAASLLKPADTL